MGPSGRGRSWPSRTTSPRCARSDCPPITDGAAAIVLAAGDVARSKVERPAWIRGIDHRVEPIHLGLRDLTVSESTRIAAEKAGVADGKVDVAELHAPFSHQELILREAHRASATTSASTRRAARWPPTR